ncbi:Rhodanese-related sulfurtransferase [Elasticomyces elasticus]|nr:Rhodanese-related sulfurtransferase [Elasticomyces elasticus]
MATVAFQQGLVPLLETNGTSSEHDIPSEVPVEITMSEAPEATTDVVDDGAREQSMPVTDADALSPVPQSTATTTNNARVPITVTKPTPYTFDLGNLLCNDPNPLPPSAALTEADLASTARDCAQALLNQLLTACPITRTPDGVALTLPPPTTPLPREKPIPVEKPMSKWQAFANKKGIKGKKREGKMEYDEASGEWRPKWGYKGTNKDGEGDWLVEIDEKKEKRKREGGEDEGDRRKEGREERRERVKRNDRRMRANEKRSGKAT